MDCIFCKIVSGEIPNFSVYEDEHVLAFLDIMPAVPGHTLVIPKTHAPTIAELPVTDLTHVMMVVRKLTSKLKEKLPCDSITVLLRDGPAAGQEVPHAHVHLIPRNKSDGITDGFPSGKKADMDELGRLAKSLDV